MTPQSSSRRRRIASAVRTRTLHRSIGSLFCHASNAAAAVPTMAEACSRVVIGPASGTVAALTAAAKASFWPRSAKLRRGSLAMGLPSPTRGWAGLSWCRSAAMSHRSGLAVPPPSMALPVEAVPLIRPMPVSIRGVNGAGGARSVPASFSSSTLALSQLSLDVFSSRRRTR